MLSRLTFLMFLIFFSNVLFASGLKTYAFTSKFIECVKSFSAEGHNYSRPGVADSGLMNGNIDSQNIDGTYWEYMAADCISPANSGFDNNALSTVNTCSSINFKIPKTNRWIYVPPSVVGKKIGVANKFWECTGAGWVTSSGKIINPNGTDISSPPPNSNSDCDAEVETVGSCTFNLKETKHGFNTEDRFGSINGDPWNGSSGSIISSCQNGFFRTLSSSCSIDTCTPGENLEWASDVGGGSSLSTCKGPVSETGGASSQSQDRQYFSTLIDAQNLTKVNVGNATFHCRGGNWVRPTSASCKTKLINELVCSSIEGAGDGTLFYCQ